MININQQVEDPGSSDGLSKATTLTGIKSKTLDLLQEQIEHEFFAERLYMSMATWLNHSGYPETAKFFSIHSLEERDHGMQFVNFILKRGESVIMPGTNEPLQKFENPRAIFVAAIDHEKFITQKIADIYATALEEGDIMALELARKFSEEQIEEEQIFISLLKMYELEDAIGIDMEVQMADYTAKTKHIIGKL